MKPYPEYKPTGLAWLPEIPKHWDWIMLSQIATEQCNKNAERTERNVLSLSYGRIIQKKNLFAGLSPQDYGTYQIISPGNIVMRLTDLQNDHKSLRTGLAEMRGIITSAYTCLKTNHNPAFLHYLLHCYDIRKVFYGLGGGVRQSIGFKDIRGLRFPFPPADEQAQIVRYLDAMTAKINKLIRAKKRQIALLQEQKQAIINQAVTRGLDPDVELKDSGIDWLGPIPKHWKTCRCRYLFKEKNNRSETGNEVHLSMSQRHGLIPDSKLAERCILSETYVGGKLCLKDDLVLNRLKAHLGVFSLAQQSGVVSPDYTVLQVYKSKILPQYSELVLKSQSCRRELQLRVRGIVEGFWRLYTDDFNEISLPLPSLREQQKILASILDKSEKINLIIQQGREKISLLTEYKNALIAAVVTGKVDVRNIAVEAVSAEDLPPSDDPDESEEQDSPVSEESEE